MTPLERRAFTLGRTLTALTYDTIAAITVGVWWPTLNTVDRLRHGSHHATH